MYDSRIAFTFFLMKGMCGGSVNARLSPQSTIVVKEQQEIHGFIFREVNMDAPGMQTFS